MIGLMLIATGGLRYTRYLPDLISSAKKFFPPHKLILFTDGYDGEGVDHKIFQPDLGWPGATLFRYHAMLKQEELLKKFSHVYYLDCDMLICQKIEESEICSSGLTNVIHPGFPDSFCRDKKSTAYVPETYHGTYFQGCVVGGETYEFLKMCRVVTGRIDEDKKNGVMAIWHDESAICRYLVDNPPMIALSPLYAFPALHYIQDVPYWRGQDLEKIEPKIRHLEKINQGSWKDASRK